MDAPITTRRASEFYAEEAVSRGKEELAQGHYWMAQRSFQEALRTEARDSWQARALLAISYLHQGSFEQAGDALERDLFVSEQLTCVAALPWKTSLSRTGHGFQGRSSVTRSIPLKSRLRRYMHKGDFRSPAFAIVHDYRKRDD